MIDRTIAPQITDIKKLNFRQAEKKIIAGCIDTYSLPDSKNPIFRIDFIFDAGIICQKKSLLASSCVSLLREGSVNFLSSEIAERLDFFGAYLQTYIEVEKSCISLFSPYKYFRETIELVLEVIFKPAFPEKEIQQFLKKSKQQFLVNQKKVANVARTHFRNKLFGDEHPYGKILQTINYEDVLRSDIVNFYDNNYQISKLKLVLSGKVEDELYSFLSEKLSAISRDIVQANISHAEINTSKSGITVFPVNDAVQSAINYGGITITRSHDDFLNLQVLVFILGGYFGSRLMSNLREKHGLTYGVSARISEFSNFSHITIGTQVNAENSKKAVNEIQREIEILKNKKINSSELNRTRKLMMVNTVRSFDGVFTHADTIRQIIDFDYGYEYFTDFFRVCNTVSAEDLLVSAQKYLPEKDAIIVVAGRY